MKKQLLVLLLVCLPTVCSVFGQTYSTPDTGVTWTLDDIAIQSPSTITVSGSTYTLMENLTISGNDSVIIDTDITLEIEADLLITVFGTFTVSGNQVTMTAANTATPYEGFRFEEFSTIDIQNATISYGGGLRVLTETFTINNCTLTNNVAGATTGGVISLSRGTPQITNNTITFNFLPAISSGATNLVSPYIFNNYIEGNNQGNSNRPQINIGTTLVNDTLKIIQNTIKGDVALDQVGGIAVSNFVGGNIRAIIDDNVITDNRYGLTVLGNNSFAYIRNNVIENNNTQNQPNIGGSGISINTSAPPMEVIASGNAIRGNLWGITVIGQASINLGDGVDNPGQNVFSENGNNGITYALYNNTSGPIMAMNNCWDETNTPNTLAAAEAVIVHLNDNTSLGEVTFDPVDCNFLSTQEHDVNALNIYPNPNNGTLFFDNQLADFKQLRVFNIQGQLVLERSLNLEEHQINLPVNPGVYFVEFNGNNKKLVKKLIVK
ncbi:MAG: T9SS type A sorting domain-containing protein [Algicola sp.]|nr:T9SS type A sorting domain-containing protein [Algicola sp.]